MGVVSGDGMGLAAPDVPANRGSHIILGIIFYPKQYSKRYTSHLLKLICHVASAITLLIKAVALATPAPAETPSSSTWDAHRAHEDEVRGIAPLACPN